MGTFKSKNRSKVNCRALHVSVDVSLQYHYCYCFTLSGKEQKPFRFSNTGKGFNYFYKKLLVLKEHWDCEAIVVGLESTGSYGEPLIHYLSTRGVTMVQVNPFHTKRVKELTDNSPGKSDPKDTQVIASLMKLGHILQVVVPRGSAAELRRLVHERERLLHDRTALYNRLHALVFVLFPEFIQLMNSIKSKSALYLLGTVPTPEKMLKRGYTWLRSSLVRISRGQLKAARAHELYEAARTSAGVQEGQEGLLLSVTHILNQLDLIETQVTETEAQITHHLAPIPTSRYIMSIKGIGEITAAAIIGEIGDISSFKHVKEIEKLAGIIFIIVRLVSIREDAASPNVVVPYSAKCCILPH